MMDLELRKYINILNEDEKKVYRSLADAGKAYRPGNTEIWYKKRNAENTPVDLTNLNKTHALVGTLRELNPSKIFSLLQGENYSPRGEADIFLSKKGVSHTSISNGDIIKSKNKILILTANGWKNINQIDEDITKKFAVIADKMLTPVEKIYSYFENSRPVANFDEKIEQEIAKLKGKTDPIIIEKLNNYSEWGKNNPGKQSFLIGSISVIATLAGGITAGIAITLLISIINELISNPKFSRALAIGSRDAILGILIRIINDLRKKQ